jgi:hypothetical protein
MPLLEMTKRGLSISPANGPVILDLSLDQKTVEILDVSLWSIEKAVSNYVGYSMIQYIFGGYGVVYTNSSNRAWDKNHQEYRVFWKVL